MANCTSDWLILSHDLHMKIYTNCNLLRHFSVVCVMIYVHRIKKKNNELREVLLRFIFRENDNAQAYEDRNADISVWK